MKKVEILLNGRCCIFNDVPDYEKNVFFRDSVCFVQYYDENDITYGFICENDRAEFSKFYHDKKDGCRLVDCDVTEDEALKFISIS